MRPTLTLVAAAPILGLLPLVGDMDELQTIFYLALLVMVIVAFVLTFVGIGLVYWVRLLRTGEHPVISAVTGFILLAILTWMVVAAYFIVAPIIVQKGCLRC